MGLSKQQMNFVGAIACAAMMGYALYAQHGLGLEPCPLCIFQRVAVIALGIVLFLAALFNPNVVVSRIYAALVLLAGGAGVAVAGRHVWLQNLPPDKVPACGPGLDFMLDAFPLAETLNMVLSGSGECADIDWAFLGLSMPFWVLVALLGLTIWGLIANWRRN